MIIEVKKPSLKAQILIRDVILGSNSSYITNLVTLTVIANSPGYLNTSKESG